MEAAILLLALAAPGQHPIKLDATLLWHELRPCGDGYRRGCGPDCYRCRSCDGLGRCYDYRGEFGYPWNPRHSHCQAQLGYASGPLVIGHDQRPLPPVVTTIDPAWQPPPWNPATLPPRGEPLPPHGEPLAPHNEPTLPYSAPFPHSERLPPQREPLPPPAHLPGGSIPPGAGIAPGAAP